MDNIEKQYLERIIKMQNEQLDKYHEYVLCSLSNNYNVHKGVQMKNIMINDDFTPLLPFIENNLNNMDLEKIFRYLETEAGLISLIEHSLVPDKNNMQFQINSNNYVKYKMNDNSIISENIYDFSSKVCCVVHDFCKPHVYTANEEVESDINEKRKEENLLDDVCDVTMTRAKILQNLKYNESQLRLIKKVFSGLKTK